MQNIHYPAVAGLFYPAEREQLHSDLQRLLAAAEPTALGAPKALVAPHAGYIYSGPVAASAYAQLSQVAQRIGRVVILAPAHRMAFRGLAYLNADYFRTPLGDIEVDRDGLNAVSDLPQVRRLDAAFDGEHSIEVHLPFLQEVLSHFRLVPLLVGDAEPFQVEEVLERLWGDEKTLIVVSSDLSHYLDYESARIMDQEATQAIESLAPERLTHHHACGKTPLSGLLLAARRHQLKSHTLDLRNSGDTAGPRNQVVGYGAYLFN